MRLLRTLSCFVFVLLCCFIPFSNTLVIDVYADWSSSYPVELTSAQTLALYGTSIPALYYNGSTVSSVSFDFWKSSKQLVSSIDYTFSSSPFLTGLDNQNSFGVDFGKWQCVAQSTNASDLSGWFGNNTDRALRKQDISTYEFLIYRCQFNPNPVDADDFDFQLSFSFPVSLAGVARVRTAFGFSGGTVSDTNDSSSISISDYRSGLKLYADSDSINPLYITSNLQWKGNPRYFNFAPMPLTNSCSLMSQNSLLAQSVDVDLALYPCPNMILHCVDTSNITTDFVLDSIEWQIRRAQSVIVKSDGGVQDGGGFDFEPACVYLCIMCPLFWGDVDVPEPVVTTAPVYQDDLQQIQTGIGDININLDSTNERLDQIIDQLDLIYEKDIAPTLDVDLTSTGPLSWIGTKIDNVAGSVVSGIRGLFVPSQTDLINFRLNLQSDFQTHFPAFFTAEDKLRNLYSIFDNSVTPRSKISVPLVEMSIPDVSNNSSVDFSFGGFDVELKPNQDKLGFLYDSLAVIIDFIATLAVLNMLRNKLHRILEGSASE